MNIFKWKKQTKLEKEIDSVLECLEDLPPNSEEYSYIINNLDMLSKIKQQEEKSYKVSSDTKALIFGNLIGIGLILGYEKTNVIASKALGFVIRGRV
jgi:hypothetical protein